MTKKMINVNKTTVDFQYLTLDEAILMLEKYKSEYGGESSFINDSYPYEDTEYLFLRVEELETDYQYELRLKNEANQKLWQEERDKKEFERLQKKFS